MECSSQLHIASSIGTFHLSSHENILVGTWYTDKDNGNDKINNNLRQLYLWIVVASVGLVL